MKKREKFTGLCYNCHKPIVFKSNVIGKGSIYFDCKYCGLENEINITMQSIMKILKPTLLILIILGTIFWVQTNKVEYADAPFLE